MLTEAEQLEFEMLAHFAEVIVLDMTRREGRGPPLDVTFDDR